MHDTVILETSGLPTTVIVTDAFLREARAQLNLLGMGGLQPVVVTHPLSTLTEAQIAQRAAEPAALVRTVTAADGWGAQGGRARP